MSFRSAVSEEESPYLYDDFIIHCRYSKYFIFGDKLSDDKQ